jgi:hypothetical protein
MNEREAMGCPDAEMLAAWSDGGLRAGERSRVEEHAAACGRCQAHLAAIARTAAAEPEPAPSVTRHRVWPWLLPAAGAAAAAIVWVIVQQPPPIPEPRQVAPQVQARDEADTPAAPPAQAERLQSPPPTTAASRAPRAPERKLEASAKEQRARANPAPEAAAPAPAALNEEIAVDTMQRRADAFDSRSLVVHRSPEGRVTWETREGISAQLVAGASPSPSVIWLVGKGGLVLLSTDGRSWHRLAFPEAVDLTGIEASSDTTASVTTADARVFTTSDGGQTWMRK